MKIGIVLNYKAAEKKKDELYFVNSRKRPWLQKANEPRYRHLTILKETGGKDKLKKLAVPADVAIGLYIETHYPGVLVDYITPDQISTRRFKQNDIVLIIIYDLLECFHLADPQKFHTFKLALKNSPNVYPPYQYEKFINNKCTYYKYLEKKNIPVAPTHCVSREKLFSKSPDNYVNNLLRKVKGHGWDSIITKPVYGQESKDFAKFMSRKGSLQGQKLKLKNYFTKNIHKYKSIIVQEYIPKVAVKCQAVNLNNSPCKFKAISCGKFCKKHQVSAEMLALIE